MERANGGNLEEYVQLQWNPDDQLEKVLSVKERIKRKRLQMKAAQNQARNNRAQYFGGIGYDSFGKRVRYLTTEAIWKIFLDICYGLNHLHEVRLFKNNINLYNIISYKLNLLFYHIYFKNVLYNIIFIISWVLFIEILNHQIYYYNIKIQIIKKKYLKY